MKILFAFNRDLNPYVDVVMGGLQAAGCPVDSGTDKFWNADLFDYDVVHIQWPETLFDWRTPSAIEVEFLRRRLKEIHARAKIVYTLHNEVSHHANETNAAALEELYSRVQSECDVMVHLGEASRGDWSARPEGAGKRHVVIPIPVYDELYAPPGGPDREAARRQLGIPRNRKVVLAFGNFRYAAEKRLAADAVAALRDRRICLLAPKWHKARDYSFSPVHPMLALRSARKAAWAWRRGWKLGAKKTMADEDVALHFAAAHRLATQTGGRPAENGEVLFLLMGVNGAELAGVLPFPSRELGYVQSDIELSLAYQAADVFACPSLEDAGPMMVSQAMMCGTPVVAFEMGIVPELIASGGGYMARLGDAEDFARGLRAMLVDDGSAGRRASDIAFRHHDPRRIAQAYGEMLDRLVLASKGSSTP